MNELKNYINIIFINIYVNFIKIQYLLIKKSFIKTLKYIYIKSSYY